MKRKKVKIPKKDGPKGNGLLKTYKRSIEIMIKSKSLHKCKDEIKSHKKL